MNPLPRRSPDAALGWTYGQCDGREGDRVSRSKSTGVSRSTRPARTEWTTRYATEDRLSGGKQQAAAYYTTPRGVTPTPGGNTLHQGGLPYYRPHRPPRCTARRGTSLWLGVVGGARPRGHTGAWGHSGRVQASARSTLRARPGAGWPVSRSSPCRPVAWGSHAPSGMRTQARVMCATSGAYGPGRGCPPDFRSRPPGARSRPPGFGMSAGAVGGEGGGERGSSPS